MSEQNEDTKNRVRKRRGGVKTDEGKRISSQNARKHGILSEILTPYDHPLAADLAKGLREEFNVETASQEVTLWQLVKCIVKLERCSRFEKEILIEAVQKSKSTDFIPDDIFEHHQYRDVEKPQIDESTFKKMELVLVRYEPVLISRMLKLMGKLERKQ